MIIIPSTIRGDFECQVQGIDSHKKKTLINPFTALGPENIRAYHYTHTAIGPENFRAYLRAYLNNQITLDFLSKGLFRKLIPCSLIY